MPSIHSVSGPKRAAAGEVERQVHAEAVALGHRVDQVARRAPAPRGRSSCPCSSGPGGGAAGASPSTAAATSPAKSPAALTRSRVAQPHRLARRSRPRASSPCPAGRAADEPGGEGDHARRGPRPRPGRLSISAWLSTMPVEGESSPATPRKRRLEPREIAAASSGARSSTPLPRRRGVDAGERRRLGGLGRDDDLAEPPVRHARARRSRRRAARRPRTQSRALAEPCGIVDAGVDHLGIARAGVAADPALGLEHHHLAARPAPAPGRTASPTTPAPTTTHSTSSIASPFAARGASASRQVLRFDESRLRSRPRA